MPITQNENKTYTENFLEKLDKSLDCESKKKLAYKVSSDKGLSVFEINKLYNKARKRGIAITHLFGIHFAFKPNELNGSYHKLIEDIKQIYKKEVEPVNYKTFLSRNRINCKNDVELINWMYSNEMTRKQSKQMYHELNQSGLQLDFLQTQE